VKINSADFIQFITIKQGISDSSIRHVLSRLGIFIEWCEKPENLVTNITVNHIERFLFELKNKGLHTNTINTYIFMLRQLLAYLRDREPETEDFLKGIKSFPKIKPVIDVLSVNEIEAILSIDMSYGNFRGRDCSRLNTVYKAMIRFLATTGCRYDECASLTLANLDISNGKARFIKTKNTEYRLAFISEPLVSELQYIIDSEKKERTDLIFTSMMNTKIREQEFIPDLKRRAVDAKVTKRVHPHLFRHSFATQLLSSGVEITKVADLLGHKDIQTTFNNYAHLADETLRKATFMHPMIRNNIPAPELLKQAIDAVRSFKLEQDKRFDMVVLEQQLAGLWACIK